MAKTGLTVDGADSLETERHSGWIVGVDSDVTPVLSVVMPTLNEEAGIRECIERVKRAAAALEVPTEIVVSDNSTDRTPEIARELGAIVVEPDETGYGYAYRFAFECTRGEYIIMGDADTTYDFEQISVLLNHLEATGADIVMGSRLDGEIEPGAMPALHRYIGNPLLTRFLNTFYDADVSDAHSGFRVFRRSVLDELDLECDGMEFASEMVMKAAERGLTIEEVPIVYHEREGEETLESFRDGWRHVRFMLVNAPTYLFSIPASAFVLAGVAMLALSLIGARVSGVFFGIQTAIVGSLLTIVGFQVGSLSVFSAITTDAIRSPKDGITQWIRENARLERGMAAGLAFYTTGAVYLTVVVLRWLSTGGTFTPTIVTNMLAFTAIVIGIQAIFSSFFLSMIAGSET